MVDEPMKSPYKDGIDFAQLAKDVPDFAKVLNKNQQLDFSDPTTVVHLTQALLLRDFNLALTLPPDRLCPPVPNRLNYLLFIDALLRSSTPVAIPQDPSATPHDTNNGTRTTAQPSGISVSATDVGTKATSQPSSPNSHATIVTTKANLESSPLTSLTTTNACKTSAAGRKIIGLDIGTGASAIYPLLGCRSNPNWSFIATDIDQKSLRYARQNIAANGLSDRITLMETKQDGPFILLAQPGVDVERLDFVMCNPPFYSSPSEMASSASAKSKPPNSACTGSPSEMVCPGGEVTFTSRIISESLRLREEVQWYTSMVGKLSSLAPLIELLKREGCTNWAVTELVQGTKTRRWVVGWSWLGWRPSLEVARGVGAGTLERKYLPFPSEYCVMVDGQDVKEAGRKLNEALRALKMHWVWDVEKVEGTGFSEGNVWSRSARRKIKVTVATEETSAPEMEMKFGVKITVKTVDGETAFLVRWLKGEDSVLFESFCGVVKRAVEGAPKTKRKADKITT